MNFNLELYSEYRSRVGIKAKDGIWDVTVFPNGSYCPATKQWLGINGRIREHEMLGKIIRNIETGVEYEIDSVNIHWYEGYYYYATIRKLGTKSHGTVFIGNINCMNEQYLEYLNEFNQKYEVLD